MNVFSRRYLAVWIGFITFLLTQLCSHFPSLTEHLYSKKLYPILAQGVSLLSGIIPFSITDIFYIFLLLLLLSTLTLWVFRKINFKKTAYIILTILAITYSLFYWFWGFNYFRQPIETRLELKSIKVTKELFYKGLALQINATNNAFSTINLLNPEAIESSLDESFVRLGPQFDFTYSTRFNASKKMIFSRFFAGNSISGYFGPFTNEVHTNKYLLPVQYPMILAHEKAHQLGITNEAEASFYGWLACLESNSKPIEYSAQLFVLMHFMKQEKTLYDSLDVKPLLKPEVLNEYLMIKEYWKNLRYQKLQNITSSIYDSYLKANSIKEGINNYEGVVTLIIKFQNQNTTDTSVYHSQ
ncbi:MAG: DUF3810 domain-containing protein [Salinivirgaceae bacterium]|jgi:hypothetical protein